MGRQAVDLVPRAASSPWLEPTKHPLRVRLVNMPFVVADRPSIQCGVLSAVLKQAGHQVDVRYYNVETAAALGGERYHLLAGPRRNQQLLGEWLFTLAAFGQRGDVDAYRRECGLDASCEDMGWSFDELVELREERLPALLDEWASDPA